MPPGFTRVIVSANTIWALNQSGSRLVGTYKNSAVLTIGMGQIRYLANDGSEGNVTSAVVEVVAGDFFIAIARQTSGGNLNVRAEESSWFAIRAV